MTGDNWISNYMALIYCIVISLLLLPLPCFAFLAFFSHNSHDHFLSVVVKVGGICSDDTHILSYVSLLFWILLLLLLLTRYVTWKDIITDSQYSPMREHCYGIDASLRRYLVAMAMNVSGGGPTRFSESASLIIRLRESELIAQKLRDP
ncbi:hypothetical protein V8E52_010150 [Russula decolorans]